MAVLDSNLTAQLSQLLTKVVEPIELVASLDDRPKAQEMLGLLNEIAALSDKITVRSDGDDARKPSFSIERPGTDIAVRFAGIPLGHEFSSLVLALVQVGGNPVKEDADLMEQVKELDGDYEFTTYMSLTCQNCPTVVQALNAMSVLNPRIKHTAVEGSLFQDEVKEKNILTVPQVYLNGEPFATGRMDMADFVAKLDTGAGAKAASKLNEREPYEVLVVGQGPAGASAAIYTARKGFRTGLVGERFGGQVLDTMAIENFISVPKTEGPKFAAALEQHVGDYEIDVIKNQSATGIIPAEKEGGLHTVTFGEDAALKARSVIIATGAKWRLMGVPGEEEYRNKGVTFCPHCDGPLFKGKRIAVVGGGNSGIEAAIDLAGIVEHVTVVEFMETLKADDVLQDKLRSMPNVDVILNAQTTEVVGDGAQVTALKYKDRATEQEHQLDLAGVFVQIGLLPTTQWLKGTAVKLSPRGEVEINDRGETSAPGIFAAGDCSTEPYKQIVVAQGSGATAALSAFDYLIRHKQAAVEA
ncbi:MULTISPECIES: alkyl hydroperoxide reductase subunit F [unclassified Luteococcus]|uniref:alkyl hydroperoxide reductase subunit F n=1 Tax=unclassified Luteococcus TaxID=2639923 RepID=UPI00313B3B89